MIQKQKKYMLGELNITLGYRAWTGLQTSFGGFFRHLKDHFVPHQRNHYTPHLVNHRTLALISLLVISLKVATVSLTVLDTPGLAQSSEITAQSVLMLTNNSRAEAGLGSVVENPLLRSAAEAKAQDMAKNGYFAHVTPTGREPWDFIKDTGYKYSAAGENLAVHFFDVEPLQDAWMNSPGHRANVLNKNYTEMGVGFAHGRFENFDTIFVVEMFGRPLQDLAPTLAASPPPQQEELVKPATIFKPSTASASPPVENTPLIPDKSLTVTDTSQRDLELASNPIAVSPKIVDLSTKVTGENLEVTATTNEVVSEMVLKYSDKGQVFKPAGNNTWIAIVQRLVLGAGPIFAEAKDMQGEKVVKQVANISTNYPSSTPVAPQSQISIFGHKIALQGAMQKTGLVLLTLVLTALVVSIARHWKVRHLDTLANASFTAILITLILVF